ncbi:MAG: hypothetical protein QM741_11990 [Rudaea sp.]|uniref:hypothetical protein n=1 Tax=Rudaea sp. TaxID=2136325 RepID=UPI0039E6A081
MNFHRYRRHERIFASLLAIIALGACSQQDDTAAQAAAAQAKADAAAAAAKRTAGLLDLYRKQTQAGEDAAAVDTGRAIVKLSAGSDAAQEVQQTLPAIEQRVRDQAEKARLASLWEYQVAPMMGGTQSTASIYSNQRINGAPVQMVLRRHTQWGQSVFLYGGRFVCKAVCTLPATFDGTPHPLRGFLPPTGEPSVMIKGDKDFIAALAKAKKIVIPVVLQDSGQSRELSYDVGGYDAGKWAPLPGAKK